MNTEKLTIALNLGLGTLACLMAFLACIALVLYREKAWIYVLVYFFGGATLVLSFLWVLTLWSSPSQVTP